MKRMLAFLLVVLAALSITACGSSGSDSGSSSSSDTGTSTSSDSGGGEPITIGAAIGESGFMTAYDGPAFNAFKLRVDQINEEGGIDGRPIEVITSDTASDPDQGKIAADDVIEKGAEMVVVSCDYDQSAPAAQAAQRAGLISMTLCAQSLKFGVQGIGPNAFSPNIATLVEGTAAAEWAIKKGWKEAFLLMDTTLTYDKETCTSFKKRFEELGGTIAGEDTFKNEDASIAPQINEIKASNPEFIRLCSHLPGAGTALRQIRAAGIDLPVSAAAAMDGSYWLESVPNLSNFYVAAFRSIYGDDDDQEVNKFVKEYEKKYGEAPPSSYAIVGATLIEAYKVAVEEAGSTDSEAVTAKMNEFKDVPTLAGLTTWTPEEHIVMDRPVAIIEIQNGKPALSEYVTDFEPPAFELTE